MDATFMHDLNNKMMALSLSVGLIDKAIETNDIDKIKHTIDKVKKYINNATDFVKISFNQISDKTMLACEVIDNIDSKIDIEVNRVQKGQHRVKKSAFTSVMENIVKNAEEAGQISKIKIYLTPSSITIFDNGLGFKKEILQAFKQGKGKTTKPNGTGTGLISIRKQMKSMGYTTSIGNKNPGSFIQFQKTQFG